MDTVVPAWVLAAPVDATFRDESQPRPVNARVRGPMLAEEADQIPQLTLVPVVFGVGGWPSLSASTTCGTYREGKPSGSSEGGTALDVPVAAHASALPKRSSYCVASERIYSTMASRSGMHMSVNALQPPLRLGAAGWRGKTCHHRPSRCPAVGKTPLCSAAALGDSSWAVKTFGPQVVSAVQAAGTRTQTPRPLPPTRARTYTHHHRHYTVPL